MRLFMSRDSLVDNVPHTQIGRKARTTSTKVLQLAIFDHKPAIYHYQTACVGVLSKHQKFLEVDCNSFIAPSDSKTMILVAASDRV